MTKPGMGLVGASLVLAIGAACVVQQAPPPATAGAPGAGCDLGSRVWQQTSPGPCAVSTWRFTLAGNGSWQAAEAGCANATGMARYDGAVVTLNFQYNGGAGIYTWPLNAACGSSPGTVTWTSGPLTGQTLSSTLAPAP